MFNPNNDHHNRLDYSCAAIDVKKNKKQNYDCIYDFYYYVIYKCCGHSYDIKPGNVLCKQ